MTSATIHSARQLELSDHAVNGEEVKNWMTENRLVLIDDFKTPSGQDDGSLRACQILLFQQRTFNA